MWKPIAAGLMCLGFVTLGVAISKGQDEETDLIVIDGKLNATEVNTDLIVTDGKVQATEVKADKAKENPQAGQGAAGIGVRTGGEAGISVDGQRFRIVRSENGEVVVSNEDGKIVERHEAGAAPGRTSARVARIVRTPHVVDSQTRESLNKMMAALKEQIGKLEAEGKKDEAQQKVQSLHAIESLLHYTRGRAEIRFTDGQPDPKQTMEEMKKLHSRLGSLAEESSKLPEGAAGEREKIKQEIEKIHREIAEKQQSLILPFPVGGAPQFAPGQVPPGMVPPQFAQQPHGAAGFPGGGFGFAQGFVPGQPGQPPGIGASEGMGLMRKAAALSQAAAQLKSNGLDEQAQPLLAQAEKLRAEAQKMMQEEAAKQRAQGGAGGGLGGGFGGMMAGGMMGGGPPMDLNRSIRELHEQIQQLRKEVGELRELLQRK